MGIKHKLQSLYSQQRKINAAQQGTDDPRLKRTLELKRQMMERRIGRAQAEEKLGE